jgi:hypothetical protein
MLACEGVALTVSAAGLARSSPDLRMALTEE